MEVEAQRVERVLHLVGHSGGEGAQRRQLVGSPELRFEAAHFRDVAEQHDQAVRLARLGAQVRRRGANGRPAASLRRQGEVAFLEQAIAGEGVEDPRGKVRDGLQCFAHGSPSDRRPAEAQQALARAVQRSHRAAGIERQDTRRDALQDVPHQVLDALERLGDRAVVPVGPEQHEADSREQEHREGGNQFRPTQPPNEARGSCGGSSRGEQPVPLVLDTDSDRRREEDAEERERGECRPDGDTPVREARMPRAKHSVDSR